MTYTFLGIDPIVKEFAQTKLTKTRIWFKDGTYGEYDLNIVNFQILEGIFHAGGIYWYGATQPTMIKFGTGVTQIALEDFFSGCWDLKEIYIPNTCSSFMQNNTFGGTTTGKIFFGCANPQILSNEYQFENIMASEIHLSIEKDQAQDIFEGKRVGRTCKVVCIDGEFTVQ